MPRPRPPARFLAALSVLAALLGPAARPAAQPARELRVAAVQLRVSAADLASADAFRAHVEGLVERCLPYHPDLILFPEYASAFLALLPCGPLLQDAGSPEEALRRVLGREPLAGDLRGLFLRNAELAESSARELFGDLARRHGAAVGAGTYFAAADSGHRPAALVNRAVIFGPRGEVLHAQDKVFLTDFEQELLGLEPGRLEEAAPFVLNGRRIGLTICRDAYFADWERVLAGAELWVDLKANGQPFTAQERESFQRALPARLAGAGVPYGLTLCLTGGLAGLVWEGESSLVRREPDGSLRVLARAGDPAGEDILLFTLPEAGPGSSP